MYVILKGRISVIITSNDTANMPSVVAILGDGDHFGELSLIDQDKVDKNTRTHAYLELEDASAN